MPYAIPPAGNHVLAVGAECGECRREMMPQRGGEHTIDVPEACGTIVRRGEKKVARGVECDVLDQTAMATDDGGRRAALNVPDANHTIHGSRSQDLVVRTEFSINLLIAILKARITRFQPAGFVSKC